jgi:hypothetical protein
MTKSFRDWSLVIDYYLMIGAWLLVISGALLYKGQTR